MAVSLFSVCTPPAILFHLYTLLLCNFSCCWTLILQVSRNVCNSGTQTFLSTCSSPLRRTVHTGVFHADGPTLAALGAHVWPTGDHLLRFQCRLRWTLLLFCLLQKQAISEGSVRWLISTASHRVSAVTVTRIR